MIYKRHFNAFLSIVKTKTMPYSGWVLNMFLASFQRHFSCCGFYEIRQLSKISLIFASIISLSFNYYTTFGKQKLYLFCYLSKYNKLYYKKQLNIDIRFYFFCCKCINICINIFYSKKLSDVKKGDRNEKSASLK